MRTALRVGTRAFAFAAASALWGCDGGDGDSSIGADPASPGGLVVSDTGAGPGGGEREVVDLGLVAELESGITTSTPLRVFDTATGVSAPIGIDSPGFDVALQPFRLDTLVLTRSFDTTEVRVLDSALRTRTEYVLPTYDFPFRGALVSPSGQALLQRTTEGVRRWSIDGELLDAVDYPPSHPLPSAEWADADRVVLRRDDGRGFLVSGSGTLQGDYLTVDISPDVPGRIAAFDASPVANEIAFLFRERVGNSVVNRVRVVDLDTGVIRTVAETPPIDSPDGRLDAYTPHHHTTHVFWHHAGDALFVVVGPQAGGGPLGQAGSARPAEGRPGVSPSRLYHVPADGDGASLIDNASPSRSSEGVRLAPREPGSYWSSLREYYSYPRQ